MLSSYVKNAIKVFSSNKADVSSHIWKRNNNMVENNTMNGSGEIAARNNINTIDNEVSKDVSDNTKQNPLPQLDTKNSHIPHPTMWERIFSWRTVIVILLHLSYVTNNIPVVTMSMAVVCMCGPFQASTNETFQNNGNFSDISGYVELTLMENRTSLQDKVYEFDWDSNMRGLLISSYTFVVFLVPHLSNIARSYLGNKLTLTIFTTVLALCNFVAPVAARTSVYFFLATRILIGLTITAQIPISIDTLAWWIPQREKLTCATFVVAGWFVSGVIMPIITGYLCKLPVDNGWPFIFYFNGTLTAVCTVAWYFLSSKKPENHPYISEKEKAYILAHRVGMNFSNDTKAADKPPYSKILTSGPVVGFLVTSICYFWSLLIILACLPLYLTSVLKFSLQDAGIIYSLNAALRLPAVAFWSALGNWLLNRTFMTTNTARKICFVAGQLVAAVLYLGTSFFDQSQKLVACALLIAATGSMSFGTTMTSVIPLDLAPRYAGFISGLASSFSSLISMTAPVLVAVITPNGTHDEWRVIWIVMTGVNIIAGLVFLVFGNASMQSWAMEKSVEPVKSVHVQASADQAQTNLCFEPGP